MKAGMGRPTNVSKGKVNQANHGFSVAFSSLSVSTSARLVLRMQMLARAALSFKRRNDVIAIGDNRPRLLYGKAMSNGSQTKSAAVDGDIIQTVGLHELLHVWVIPIGAAGWLLNGNIS